MELLKFTFSGAWTFIGVFALCSLFLHYVLNFILSIWARFMRLLMVRKSGWPPNHLDADGDFKPEPETEQPLTD